MGKKIVISFPGIRRCEIPLLYFASKHYEDMGYEKVFINYPALGESNVDALLENTEKALQTINFAEYESIVFVAKSIGTVVACKLKEKYQIPALLILFTPIDETLPYIHKKNDILLVAAGDKDRHLDSEQLSRLCEKENINYYIEPGVGHRMEVEGDLRRNLEIVHNVISKIRMF